MICDIIRSIGRQILGYCEKEEKEENPYALPFLGSERIEKTIYKLKTSDYFIALGANSIRKKIIANLEMELGFSPTTLIHKNAVISPTSRIACGTMVGGGCQVNACAKIGKGTIINTGAVIEHECLVGDFVHVAPRAVLCGNVSVGEGSFIGANAVLKQGIKIGKNVIIGAGTVVIRDIPDDGKVVGNPQRFIKS